MKRFLFVSSFDVADEGDVGLIKVVTEKETKEYKSLVTGFGNIDGERISIDESDFEEITEEEYAVLKKFGLTSMEFGTCYLSEDSCDDDEE